MAKHFSRVLVLVVPLGFFASAALADEIVHFANGAEMTVRSHTVEQEAKMVKLDLGGNSFIAFPMSMVDKIVSAGRDVFLNPTFHPSNQAVAGVAGVAPPAGTGSNVADTTIGGGGASPVGFVPQQGIKGAAGVMLGEVADTLPVASRAEGGVAQSMPVHRRVFNPAFPSAPGDLPQVILPPAVKGKPVGMALGPRVPVEPQNPQPAPPQGEPVPEDPPENP